MQLAIFLQCALCCRHVLYTYHECSLMCLLGKHFCTAALTVACACVWDALPLQSLYLWLQRSVTCSTGPVP